MSLLHQRTLLPGLLCVHLPPALQLSREALTCPHTCYTSSLVPADSRFRDLITLGLQKQAEQRLVPRPAPRSPLHFLSQDRHEMLRQSPSVIPCLTA